MATENPSIWDQDQVPSDPWSWITDPSLGDRGYQQTNRPSQSGGGPPTPWPGTPITEPLYPNGLPEAAPSALTASGFNLPDLLKWVIGGGLALGGATQQTGIPPELSQLMDLQRQRLEASNPLYESVLRLAFSRLPTNATAGLPTPQMPR